MAGMDKMSLRYSELETARSKRVGLKLGGSCACGSKLELIMILPLGWLGLGSERAVRLSAV